MAPSTAASDPDPPYRTPPPPMTWQRRWQGVVIVLGLFAVTLALPLWAGHQLRTRIIAEAEREIATQADIVANATQRRLQALRFALYGLPSWIDGPVLASAAVDEDVHEALKRIQSIGGSGIGFIALAPDGRLVASSIGLAPPGAPANHSSRSNLVTLGPTSPSGLAFAAPHLGQASHIRDRPVVAVSRALPGGGWVQAIVQLEASGLLPPIDLGDGSSGWLVREDGQVIANWPPPVNIPLPKFNLSAANLDVEIARNETTRSDQADTEPPDVISAHRSLEQFGLLLIVQRDRSAVLASWRRGMATTLAGLGIALLAATALAWRAAQISSALTRSEYRGEMIADALGLLLWSRPDRASTSTYHGRMAEKLTGYATKELTSAPGQWREKVVHPDDRPRVARELAEADLSDPLHQTYRIIRADGEVRWIEQLVRAAPWGGVIGVTYDVTEKKETQERLAQSEAELAEAMRIAGLGRWRLELDANEIQYSPDVLEQMGLSAGPERAPMHMDHAFEMIDPDDRTAVVSALARVRYTGETVEFEYRLRRPDGAVRYRWARAAPELSSADRIRAIVGVCQDITERREAAMQLANATRLAALGQLTGGIAHDVNNMLTVVSLNLDLLADEVVPGTPAAEALEAARRAASGGSELTTQLLAFARRQPLRPAAVDVTVLFDELRPMLTRTLGRGVTAELRAAPGTPRVLADAAQLRSALLNLAINARDAMPEGGAITVTAELDEEEEFVGFAVADEGGGMPPEVIARAFEPFFTTKPAGKGTGLGLAQVYGFVTQSQGRISIDSAPGEGTVVRFSLPVAPEERRATPRGAGAAPLKGARVLIVEDETGLRMAVAAMCRSAGLDVAEADSAATAMGMLEGGFRPDLLFTDINLGPGPDGVALAALARRMFPSLRVLFATGYAEVQVPDGVPLLRKPYARETLLAALARVLSTPETVGA